MEFNKINLIGVLESTSNPTQVKQATSLLEQWAPSYYPTFALFLSEILADTSLSPVARAQAGLCLKNVIKPVDDSQTESYEQMWLGLDLTLRSSIKNNVVNALGTESNTGNPTSAIAIACILCAECASSQEIISQHGEQVTVPTEVDPVIVQRLVELADIEPLMSDLSRQPVIEATLDAIGYLLEELSNADRHDSLPVQSVNMVLGSIASAAMFNLMNVRFKGVKALYNSLPFLGPNLDSPEDCNNINYILLANLDVRGDDDLVYKILSYSLQSINYLIAYHYKPMVDHIPHYFAKIDLLLDADNEDTVINAIEFYTSLCNVEISQAQELESNQAIHQPVGSPLRYYGRGLMPMVVPKLLVKMVQNELDEADLEDDDENWTIHKAASVALTGFAETCSNMETSTVLVGIVVEFVQNHFKDTRAEYRDAAILAFGSIVTGPPIEVIGQLLDSCLAQLQEALRTDPSPVVQDSAVWTIGHILDNYCSHIIETYLFSSNSDANLQILVDDLLRCLESHIPSIASHACWALATLSTELYALADNNIQGSEMDEPETYALSSRFQDIASRLMQTAARDDFGQNTHKLRTAAFEALNEYISNAPLDCLETVRAITQAIIERHTYVVEQAVHSRTTNDMYSLLSSSIQAALGRLPFAISHEIVPHILHNIQQLNLVIPNSSDSLMTIVSIIQAAQGDSLPFLEVINPIILSSVHNYSEQESCSIAIGLIGDISRAVGGEGIHNYAMGWSQCLFEVLIGETAARKLKPSVFATFGDLALALGVNTPEIQNMVNFLTQAINSPYNFDANDFEEVDFANTFYDSLVCAFVGFVQGLKGTAENPTPQHIVHIEPQMPTMLTLIEKVCALAYPSNDLMSSTLGLVGDLCEIFQKKYNKNFLNCNVMKFIHNTKTSDDPQLKRLAAWVSKKLS